MKRHKFNAKPTEVDGIRFASKLEADRYQQLKMLERAGEIEGLELQPKFPFTHNGVKIGSYIADFRYWDRLEGVHVVEDCKGVLTPVYRLKKKLMAAFYPDVTIEEITR